MLDIPNETWPSPLFKSRSWRLQHLAQTPADGLFTWSEPFQPEVVDSGPSGKAGPWETCKLIELCLSLSGFQMNETQTMIYLLSA